MSKCIGLVFPKKETKKQSGASNDTTKKEQAEEKPAEKIDKQ